MLAVFLIAVIIRPSHASHSIKCRFDLFGDMLAPRRGERSDAIAPECCRDFILARILRRRMARIRPPFRALFRGSQATHVPVLSSDHLRTCRRYSSSTRYTTSGGDWD